MQWAHQNTFWLGAYFSLTRTHYEMCFYLTIYRHLTLRLLTFQSSRSFKQCDRNACLLAYAAFFNIFPPLLQLKHLLCPITEQKTWPIAVLHSFRENNVLAGQTCPSWTIWNPSKVWDNSGRNLNKARTGAAAAAAAEAAAAVLACR